MSTVGHRPNQRVIGDHHVKWWSSRHCPFENGSYKHAGRVRMNFRILKAGAEVNHTTFILLPAIARNRGQMLDIHLDTMATYGKGIPLSFFGDVRWDNPAAWRMRQIVVRLAVGKHPRSASAIRCGPWVGWARRSAMTAAPQAAEVGRELPQVGGVAASASGGPDLEQLAKQVYDVLKRRLQSDRRRGGL